MTKLNMVQAINLALYQEMKKNSKVLVLGEDVGKNGGVFRVTDGLYEKFGENRVIDTPLAESAIIGASLGLAVRGFRPVAEAQFDGFSYPMLDQLISHVSKIRKRSQGKYSVPLVLRFPYGGGIRALEHHSESPETHFVHTPGLKVVVPATPYDAKGLLISALRDPDPTVFMEPKRVYRAIKEEVPEKEYTIPLGKANVQRDGKDVTLIAWGAMVKICLEAAEKIADKYSVEVINLRTLSPLDIDTIVESVKKTGRVVVAQEAPKNVGFAAEIVAMIDEKAFLSLEAPVTRVASPDIPTPLPKLEQYFFPDVDKVIKGIETVMNY